MINEYLKGLTEAQQSAYYDSTGSVMMAVFMLTLLLILVRFRLPWKRAVAVLAVFYISYRWATNLVSMLGQVTGYIIPSPNLGVAFALFVLIEIALALALRIPAFDILDATVPVMILGRGVGIIGCLFPGCCHGFPAEWGIYSNDTGCNTVPTVPLDIAFSWGMAAYLLHLLWKERRPGSGRVTARALVLFGILRLAIDLLRDNRKLLMMLTVEGFCGIAYILAGWYLWRRLHRQAYQNS